MVRREWVSAAGLLLAAAFFLRGWEFGNSIKGLDEQFYLLIGDRMWSGAVPYVDIWDRKPIGLFLLFAGIRMLGGNGIVQAQIVATVFAATTAFIVYRIARRHVDSLPAILGGMTYLIGAHLLWGGNTQTPVFYNLFIATAAWLVLQTAPSLNAPGDRGRATAAMLLAGLAIQIKTNAAFEGGFFGVWLVWRLYRAGAPLPRIATIGSSLALTGLFPTLIAGASYAAIGHFDAWWFANAVSQLIKHTDHHAAMLRLGETTALVAPVILLVAIGLLRMTDQFSRWSSDALFLGAWAGVCMVDGLALGGFWAHYMLPLVIPAAILSASAYATPRFGLLGFAIFSTYPIVDATLLDHISATDERAHAEATVAAIPDDVTTECMFIYQGPVIYYHLKHACAVTKFMFSDHLRSAAEADALGEDASTALRSALAKRPGVILDVENSLWKEPNRTNNAILAAELRRNYTATARLPQEHHLSGKEWLIVWRRNDLVSRGNRPRNG
ncbi:glycosyltransferase family 39 protein [Sphingomonas aliaeris]|uniref:Glycosyltransferase family 39 protein n=1 Tax=Sphingomonas aliaeris TaxID=2759526 RepID=A0A974NX05_9SPHN|nr:glycosyltransferase family 39 protein [Sphingomonas aliaeris]QQV78368.1 glycosyltransferase family 39 protein [Sphingomonas aliaeris]